jgi:hypothetical protein
MHDLNPFSMASDLPPLTSTPRPPWYRPPIDELYKLLAPLGEELRVRVIQAIYHRDLLVVNAVKERLLDELLFEKFS